MSEHPLVPAVLTQLAGLFTGTGSLVLLSRVSDGAVVAISPGLAEVVGLAPEQILGRTALELGLWRDAGNRASIIELIRQRGAAIAEPISILSPGGRHLDGLMTSVLIRHEGSAYFFALIQDVRAYASEADARQRELASNRALVMQSAIGFYRVDLQSHRLLELNPALARMLGATDTLEVLAAPLCTHGFDYVRPEQAGFLRERLLREGQFVDERCELRRLDGGTVWVSESARLVRDGNGQPLQREGTLVDISLQVVAEGAFAQSEALYRNLVENSRDGVFLMQHGRVLFANEALATILDAPLATVIGANYLDWIDPTDREAQMARRASREAGSDATQEYDVHLLRRDGSRRLCAVRAGAVQYAGAPASIGTLRDVTEARAQQRRLEAAETRYRLLFQHAVMGLFQTTLDGAVIEVNEALAQMFGYADAAQMRAEVPAMGARYAHAEDRARILERLQREQQILGAEIELLRRDGTRFYGLFSARLVPAQGTQPSYLEGSLLDNTARRQAEDELLFLAHRDSLTLLHNRRSFENLLREALSLQLADHPTQRAVLLLDLDRFKLVNDSLGHAAGDELLQKFALRLRESLDSRAVLARYGGDEFALLSRGACDATSATALAHRVQHLLSAPFQLSGHQVFTSASIGIVLLAGYGDEPEEVLRDADTAMFRAKAAGGGVVLFDAGMHAAARERLALETDLRFALERGELITYYQPLCALEDQRVLGVEALVRWQHPSRGLLLPGQFLGVAEEMGLLPAIDLLVLDQALEQFRAWQARYAAGAPQRLSVNLSDRLISAGDFPAQLASRLARSGVDPALLHLEITETVFRGRGLALGQTLQALKHLGVRLVVDDFGTGYSSLVSFSDSAFDGLKIDRGFIHDLETNPRHRAIVRTIAAFAHDLDLSLVAEGVENEVQAHWLRQLGCRVAQGFLYAPALPAAALSARLGMACPEGDAALQA